MIEVITSTLGEALTAFWGSLETDLSQSRTHKWQRLESTIWETWEPGWFQRTQSPLLARGKRRLLLARHGGSYLES